MEHNMWAYIFFFIHLDDTKPNDYTALELYVYELVCFLYIHYTQSLLRIKNMIDAANNGHVC